MRIRSIENPSRPSPIKDQFQPQVAGRVLHIPVWVVNDHKSEIPLDVQCQVLDLAGREIHAQFVQTAVGPDQSKTAGILKGKL